MPLTGPYPTQAQAAAACGSSSSSSSPSGSQSSASDTSSGASSESSLPPVDTECCPGVEVPARLYLTISAIGGGGANGCNSVLSGLTIELVYGGDPGSPTFWYGEFDCPCVDTDPPRRGLVFFYCCPPFIGCGPPVPFPLWGLQIGVPYSCSSYGGLCTSFATADSCSPFSATTPIIDPLSTGGNCSGTSYQYMATITE